jgi:hypothetical protein
MNTIGEKNPRIMEITILPIDATTLRFQSPESEIRFSMHLWPFGDKRLLKKSPGKSGDLPYVHASRRFAM